MYLRLVPLLGLLTLALLLAVAEPARADGGHNPHPRNPRRAKPRQPGSSPSEGMSTPKVTMGRNTVSRSGHS
ncbi:MAG: hypothetical protein HGA45_09845 [Chloroflexales bacterium]|nr:hypothetical protein [Chloroflexales bacterium]